MSLFILKLGDIWQYLEIVVTITAVYDIDATRNEWVETIDILKPYRTATSTVTWPQVSIVPRLRNPEIHLPTSQRGCEDLLKQYIVKQAGSFKFYTKYY